MPEDNNFQRKWDFRRRDEGFDSTDDSELNLCAEMNLKKQRSIPGLLSPQNEEPANPLRPSEGNARDGNDVTRNGSRRSKPTQSRRKKWDEVKKKKDKDLHRKSGGKKSDSIVHESAPLKDIKVFVKSLISDLEAERKKICSWMRKEVDKLCSADNRPQRSKRVNNSKENIQLHNQKGKGSLQGAKDGQQKKTQNVTAKSRTSGKGTVQKPKKKSKDCAQERIQLNSGGNSKVPKSKPEPKEQKKVGSSGNSRKRKLKTKSDDGPSSVLDQSDGCEGTNNVSEEKPKAKVKGSAVKPMISSASPSVSVLQVQQPNNLNGNVEPQNGNVGFFEKPVEIETFAFLASVKKGGQDSLGLFSKLNSSSSHHLLPNISTEPLFDKQKINSSMNYTPAIPNVGLNRMAMDFQKQDAFPSNSQYLQGSLGMMQSGNSFSQITSGNGFENHYARIGFPIPFHHGMSTSSVSGFAGQRELMKYSQRK